MGGFLLHSFPSARRTWEEAEEALGTFEKWRKELGLEQEEGMARFELEKWPSWQKERNKEELRRIVFGGPQVRCSSESYSRAQELTKKRLYIDRAYEE
jgi:hypothetical protein